MIGSTAPTSSSVKRTRVLFIITCLYLLSQSFMIPIRAIGPSWSLWPTLADILIVPLIGVAVLGFRSRRAMTPHHRSFLRAFGLLVLVASLGMLRTLLLSDEREAMMYGLYFLYRFLEFFCLFWAISQMVWTQSRFDTLRLVVDIVLLVTCGGVILTFLGVIPLGSLIAHLPQTREASGPWMAYPLKDRFPEDGRGLGFVGYNHAYAGVQIVALTALRFALSRSRVSIVSACIVLVALVASFFTESRAGFVALIFFAGTQFARNPRLILASIPLALFGLVLFEPDHSQISGTMERQQTLLEATEGDNLSGRPMIWRTYTTYLIEHPAALLVGAGLGSSYPITRNRSCHMTPLQYLFELGLIGWVIYMGIVFRVGHFLYHYESGTKPLFFAFLSLHVASLTMETFYPIPYLGHFLGLCLMAVAIELSKSTFSRKRSEQRLIPYHSFSHYPTGWMEMPDRRTDIVQKVRPRGPGTASYR